MKHRTSMERLLLPSLFFLAACSQGEGSGDRICTFVGVTPFTLTVNTSDTTTIARRFDLVVDGVTGSCEVQPSPSAGALPAGPCTFDHTHASSPRKGQYVITWDTTIPTEIDIRMTDGEGKPLGEYRHITTEPHGVEPNGPGCGVLQTAQSNVQL